MSQLVGWAAIAVSVLVLARVSRAAAGPDAAPPGAESVLIGAFAATAVFLGPPVLLGWLELATGLRLVRPVYAGSLTVALGAAALLLLHRPGISLRRPEPPLEALLKPASLLIWLSAGAWILVGLFTLLQYPRGYEVLAYHLPTAAAILQNGSLAPWDPQYPHTFAALGSVYYAMLLAALPEHVVSAANFPFAALLITSLYALARKIGATRNGAVIAALGALTLPLVGFNVVELAPDIPAVAMLAVAFYFAAFARSTAVYSAPLLAGVACGLAFGFKPLHLLSSTFVFLVLSAGLWRAETPVRAGGRWSRVGAGMAAFSFGFLVTGGYWMARNWLLLGNPLHPAAVPLVADLFGWHEASGFSLTDRHSTQYEWVRSSSEWLVYPWVEWHSIGQNFKAHAGAGAFFATMAPVAWLAGSLAVACRATGWQRLVPFVAGTAWVVGWWWILGDRQPRYLLGSVVFLIPLVAWVLSASSPRLIGAFSWLASLSAAVGLFVIVSKEAIVFGDRIVYERQFERHKYYEYPPEVDQLPAGSVIVNFCDRAMHYPLFGDHLQNIVVSTPAAREAFRLPQSLDPVGRVAIDGNTIASLGATHLFTCGTRVVLDDCLALRAVGRGNAAIDGAARLAPQLFEVRFLCPK